MRSEKYVENLQLRQKRTLRSPLDIGEKVSLLVERLRKKDASGKLYKSTTENRPLFNRNRIFTINKRVRVDDNTYNYWLKENGQEIKNRFLKRRIVCFK